MGLFSRCFGTPTTLKGRGGGTGKASTPSAPVREASAAPDERARPPSNGTRWEEHILHTLPVSVVILSSDARDVLHQCSGSEPAAAQLLHQALQLSKGCTGSSSTSMLTLLMGPKLEAAAMEALAQGRTWRGTVVACQSAGPSESAISRSRGELALSMPHMSCTGGGNARSNASLHTSEVGTSSSKLPAGAAHERLIAPKAVGANINRDRGTRLWEPIGPAESAFQSAHADKSRAVIPRGDGARFSHAAHQIHRGSPELGTRGSLRFMQEQDVDRLLTGSYRSDDCPRTAALLKGLSQVQLHGRLRSTGSSRLGDQSSASISALPHAMARASSDGAVRLSTAQGKGFGPYMSKQATPENAPEVKLGAQKEIQEHPTSSLDTSHLPAFQEGEATAEQGSSLTADSRNLSLGQHPPQLAQDITTSGTAALELCDSFDISVSPLSTVSSETGKAPILVGVHNVSDHGQAKSVLASLAESQLELLSNIMPLHALQFLAMESREAIPANIGLLAHRHKDATIAFLDLVGFTSYSKSVKPVDVLVLLNSLFSAFDQLTDQCRVHKVETAGDCYIISGGILAPQPSTFGFSTIEEPETHSPAEAARRVMDFAIRALEVASTLDMPRTQSPLKLRVGIHSGDCVSGLIGSKLPKFSCFGDAMNVASRMESTGIPGHIHVSEATYKLLQHEYHFKQTSGVQVKGQGFMITYLWVPSSAASRETSQPQLAHRSNTLSCDYLKQACHLLQQVSGLPASQPLPCIEIGSHGSEERGPEHASR